MSYGIDDDNTERLPWLCVVQCLVLGKIKGPVFTLRYITVESGG